MRNKDKVELQQEMDLERKQQSSLARIQNR